MMGEDRAGALNRVCEIKSELCALHSSAGFGWLKGKLAFKFLFFTSLFAIHHSQLVQL